MTGIVTVGHRPGQVTVLGKERAVTGLVIVFRNCTHPVRPFYFLPSFLILFLFVAFVVVIVVLLMFFFFFLGGGGVGVFCCCCCFCFFVVFQEVGEGGGGGGGLLNVPATMIEYLREGCWLAA